MYVCMLPSRVLKFREDFKPRDKPTFASVAIPPSIVRLITDTRRFETCALGQYCHLMRVGCSASVCVRDEVARAKRPGKWRNFHESCRTS